MKELIKKFLPKQLIAFYHKSLAVMASFFYGFPSEKLIVIGVTGTNGKSTTVALITKVLETSGAKVGSTSTVSFKVAEQEWLNDKKMTMLGRFQLQKLLKKMVKAGCKYAVIETSSQGIEQYRHLGINYDYVVFTNLTPEHIESHGSFENYKRAKGKLFDHLTKRKTKNIEGQNIEKVSVVNIDDEHSDYFAEFPADKNLFYSIKQEESNALMAKDISASPVGTSFTVHDEIITLKLLGSFNVYNSLPAILIALEEGVPMEKIKEALEQVEVIPGRMEIIDEGQDYWVLVDYAPEPASMLKLYETVKLFRQSEMQINKIIHVFGSCGGGRDKARRPVLGQIVGTNADYAIVTNEDPYDEDPIDIINQVVVGSEKVGKTKDKDLFIIVDRREAIQKALKLAQKNDLVIITGKGAEQAMAVANGQYVEWDDRKIVRELLNK